MGTPKLGIVVVATPKVWSLVFHQFAIKMVKETKTEKNSGMICFCGTVEKSSLVEDRVKSHCA